MKETWYCPFIDKFVTWGELRKLYYTRSETCNRDELCLCKRNKKGFEHDATTR